jgi:hypothetical protein
MAINDIATLDTLPDDALDHDRLDTGNLFPLRCGAVRQLWRLFTFADEQPALQQLVAGMEAREPRDQVRGLSSESRCRGRWSQLTPQLGLFPHPCPAASLRD